MHGRPALRANPTGKLSVALENDEHDDAARGNLIDDAITSNDDLADVVAPQLGNAAPGARHPGRCPRAFAKRGNPFARGLGVVSGNESRDLEKIVLGPKGPAKPAHRLRLPN